MTTCKKHPTDLCSAVGVCASCLRQRLFSVLAAQAEAQSQLYSTAQAQHHDDRRPPPPLAFPRSVSPYVSRRKSDTSSWTSHHRDDGSHCFADQRFYRTPQVGPNGSVLVSATIKKKHSRRFAIFSNFFRSKPRKVDSDPVASESHSSRAASSSSSSPFWFTNMLNSRRKEQQSRMSSQRESTAEGNRKASANRHREMFPEGYSDNEDEEEEGEGDQYSGGSSGYSSESSQGWKRTPRATKVEARRSGRRTHRRNASGLAFCLSPLVRASPSRQWNQKAMLTEMAESGDIRVATKSQTQYVANAASFCKSGSKKLVDMGRSAHHNR